MNQILITEKIYVTPELKRKKKIYKFLFLISIFLIIMLSLFYFYADYSRNKSEEISKQLLEDFISKDDTIISTEQNALIVKLTQDVVDNATEEEQQTDLNLATATEKYTTESGTYDIIGRITIPKINVDYPIFSETSDALLKISICKFHGGSPNEVGNLCLAGHNYKNSRFFSKVDTLVIGDIIEITDLSKRTIQYEVYDIHTVDPTDRSDTTQLTNGKKEVTLITCTDDTKQRIIVKCTEKI